MDFTTGLVVVVAGLATWLLYEKNKRKSAEALNDNAETKEKVLEIEKEVIKNEALNEAEEEKRKTLKDSLEEEKKKDVSEENILDFFNRKSDK